MPPASSLQATELLVRGEGGTQRERDLMKAVPEQEGINQLVGTVKLQVRRASFWYFVFASPHGDT